jgi:hypothetical protein
MTYRTIAAVMLAATLCGGIAHAAEFKSKAFCLPAVFKSMQVANPSDAPWSTPKPGQHHFMLDYGNGPKADLAKMGNEVEAIATSDPQTLNDWFAARGFPGMNVPAGVKAVGSVFDLLVDWTVPGARRDMAVRQGAGNEYAWYEGVNMKSEDQSFESFRIEGYSYPLFRLDTRQGWQVYLVEAADGDEIGDAAWLPDNAKKLLSRPRTPVRYRELTFPAVSLSADVDISWMAGMEVPGFRIDEAIKKVKLRLDDKGARAQSAVAFVMKSIASNTYTIGRQFYVIFTRDDMNFPPFVALVASDSWTRSARQ